MLLRSLRPIPCLRHYIRAFRTFGNNATILYYLHNKEAVSNYIAEWLEWSHQQLKAQQLNPSPSAIRLRKLRAEREAIQTA